MVMEPPTPALLFEVRVGRVAGQEVVQSGRCPVDVAATKVIEDLPQPMRQVDEPRRIRVAKAGNGRGIDGEDPRHYRAYPTPVPWGALCGRQRIHHLHRGENSRVFVTIETHLTSYFLPATIVTAKR